MKDSRSAEIAESKKRRREILTVVGLIVLFLILLFVEIKLFDVSEKLPFVHSVFFFGLVNFNIVILLLLLFLAFRNVVKVFVERSGRVIGSSLKSKLVIAFLGFSIVPTILMFLISVFYINSSFDKWFSLKVAGVLKSSLEVNSQYYTTVKKENYHFARLIADKIENVSGDTRVLLILERARSEYKLDSVEFFGETKPVIRTVSEAEVLPAFPEVEQGFLKRGVREKVESSTIQRFGEGNLVRVTVPVKGSHQQGALVVSTFVPLSLIAKMDDIALAYEEIRDFNPLEYPLKSIYLIILVLMTLVILLGASWFGFHLAKNLSIPLALLGDASRRISRGKFEKVTANTGSEEINQLVENFNRMSAELEKSEKNVSQANEELRSTLDSLNEQKRYTEVILSNVSTGVVAVDPQGMVTMMNRYASQLLGIDSQKVIGKSVKDILNDEYYRIVVEMLKTMRRSQSKTLRKEIHLTVNGQPLPMQVSLSWLIDQSGNDLGKVFVFDDLTIVVNAQRAAAWREVARRIAHEIKNPLTPIRLAAQRLQKKFGQDIDDPAFKNATQMILTEVDGLKNLVNEFSNFARMPEVNLEKGQIKDAVEDVVGIYKLSRRDVDLVFERSEDIPEFEFDGGQLKRVVNNLIENALDAVSEVERPQIKIELRYDNDLQIVQIRIRDNGVGISEGMKQKIFEPYFSTKKHGTGLGLPIVKRIVEDHNGFVRAHPINPAGTEILLEFPVSSRRQLGVSAEKGASASPTSTI